jgi:hypothetical protein
MIRELVRKTYSGGLAYAEYAGVSTDTKPTTGIITGSKFTEADTGDVYMFYEGDSPSWGKIQAGPVADDP